MIIRDADRQGLDHMMEQFCCLGSVFIDIVDLKRSIVRGKPRIEFPYQFQMAVIDEDTGNCLLRLLILQMPCQFCGLWKGFVRIVIDLIKLIGLVFPDPHGSFIELNQKGVAFVRSGLQCIRCIFGCAENTKFFWIPLIKGFGNHGTAFIQFGKDMNMPVFSKAEILHDRTGKADDEHGGKYRSGDIQHGQQKVVCMEARTGQIQRIKDIFIDGHADRGSSVFQCGKQRIKKMGILVHEIGESKRGDGKGNGNGHGQ